MENKKINLKDTLHLFVDMDGVLCEFAINGEMKEEIDWTESGLFDSRLPVKEVVQKVKLIIKQNDTEVHILTAAPMKNAWKEKINWLRKYMPEIKKENIHIIDWKNEDKIDSLQYICFNSNINIDNVLLVDDTHSILFKATKYGIASMHPSTFLARPISFVKALLDKQKENKPDEGV